MEVPIRLAKREHTAPADGVFVPGDSVADLLAVCAQIGDRWPAIFPLHGGFVVVPVDRLAKPIPGTVRLRRLGGDLFVPADADLRPALRSDEIVGLTRTRGLVFLPGGDPLAFDPNHPLQEADLLRVDAMAWEDWAPLDAPPTLADRLHTIRLDAPPTVVEILQAGEPDDADPLSENANDAVPDDARPPSGSLAKRTVAGAGLAAGQMLAWLGKNLGLGGLAAAGANLARRAIENVPRLSEKVLGDQEAALRELLRQFQAGDIERALKRAPIAVPDANAARGEVARDSRLSSHNARYSLRDMLSSGGGHASVWLGGGDVWALLAAEYWRQAEAATRRGDFRRAAYIYGVLLRDPRQAAQVLDAGGLHRDAAILFRDKVRDLPAAAGCFERGGLWDEAIEIYQKLEQFEKAGDLYRRIGDDVMAELMFFYAVDRLTAQHHYLQAGDLLRTKAGYPSQAVAEYERGWRYGGADAPGCGSRLLDYHVENADHPKLLELVESARTFFAPPKTEPAGLFFAQVARHADRSTMPDDLREELRDRARLALAGHLAHHARNNKHAGAVVSQAFGHSGVWAGPVVRDANVALKQALKPEVNRPSPQREAFRLLEGPITAATITRDTFDLIVANAKGAIVVWRGPTNGLTPIAGNSEHRPIAIATDGWGRHVVAMSATEDHYRLESFVQRWWQGFESPGTYQQHDTYAMRPYLEPHIEADETVRYYDHCSEIGLQGPSILPVFSSMSEAGDTPYFALTTTSERWTWRTGFILFESVEIGDSKHEIRTMELDRVTISYFPAPPPGSQIVVPFVDRIHPRAGAIELVCVDERGAVRWCDATWKDGSLRVEVAAAYSPRGYRVAAMIRPGYVVAVDGANTLHWLNVEKNKLVPASASRRLSHPSPPVFLAHRPQSHEVVVVFADGTAMSIAKP